MAVVDRKFSEIGSSLLEVLAAIVLFSIVGITLARSSVVSQNSLARTIRNSQSMQVALETLESYYPVDPISLDDTDDYSDIVTKDGVKFSRAVNITVNADSSRTVTVTVSKDHAPFTTFEVVSNTFALQGSS